MSCPVLWTPRFYHLSGFVDTALLLPVHFCGHRAFITCPLLWTPCFYRLSGFVDTLLLPSVHFCGHHAFTVCPLLWTPCFLLSVRFCGHFPFTATQNSRILEFSMAHFCARMTDFCQISLFSRSISLFVLAVKFHNTGIFNDAFLRVNNGLLPNILVFTLNFSIRRQLKIPVYWNFYSVSLVTILCCFNSRVKWYLTWVVIAYYFNNRVSYYLTCLLFEHCKKHCEEVSGKTFSLLQGGSGVERPTLLAKM